MNDDRTGSSFHLAGDMEPWLGILMRRRHNAGIDEDPDRHRHVSGVNQVVEDGWQAPASRPICRRRREALLDTGRGEPPGVQNGGAILQILSANNVSKFSGKTRDPPPGGIFGRNHSYHSPPSLQRRPCGR